MDRTQMDLTQGRITKQLIRFATPLMLSSLLQTVYSFVDMLVVGQFVGQAGLSGVNNGGQVMHAVTQVIIGLTTGGNILVSQYFGSRDEKNFKDTIVTLFSLSMILGVVLAMAFYFLTEPILNLLGAPAMGEARTYLSICSIGILFISGYNGLSSALRAVGNSKQPLYFILVSTVLNVALDLVLVIIFQMGVAGAALATVIAQGVSFVLALVYTLWHKDTFGLRLAHLYIRANKLRMMMKLGIPCAVQWSVASISWLVVTSLYNSYGVSVSAGAGVSAKIKDFCQIFSTAMSTAASSMIAQNIGAQLYDRAKKVMYTAMKISLGISVVMIIIIQLFAPYFVRVFTNEPDVINAAVRNLRIEILGQVFYASFYMYHALALGSGQTWYVLLSSFTNCILVRVLLANVFNHIWGLDGIYWACMIAPFISVPMGFIYAKSGIWKRTLVADSN